jgi:hypothetical protein
MLNLSTYSDRVPIGLLYELEAYVNDRSPVSFSTDRLLSNDLLGAVFVLDEETLAALKPICEVICWELPATCHGSAERVAAWLHPERQPQPRTDAASPADPTPLAQLLERAIRHRLRENEPQPRTDSEERN